MSVTTKTIADICGVSRGTVDRALNDRPGVNPETRQKIMETASKLGYRPHFLARSLVKGRTMTLGVVVFDLYNSFFAQLLNTIEMKAREAGYFVYLTLTNKDPLEEKRCIEHLVDRKVDGLILCSVNQGSDYMQYLQGLDIPVVSIINRIHDDLPYVGINDRLAMKDAARYLMGRGYSKIIYLSPPLSYKGKMNIYAQEQRYLGFNEAMGEAGSGTASTVVTGYDYANIPAALKSDSGNRTAVLCSSDFFALELMNRFKTEGICLPADAGLMGFDNLEILKYIVPSLTTVAYSIETIGTKSVDLLVGMLEDQAGTTEFLLEHSIVPGATT